MNALRRQLQDALELLPGDERSAFRARLSLPPDLAVFAAHFPGNPVLPGICLVQAALVAAARHLGVERLQMKTLKNAKFFSPAFPGQTVDFAFGPVSENSGEFEFKTRLTEAGKRMASIHLVAVEDLGPN